MNRFILTPEATDDLDSIIAYLRGLPIVPANQIGRSIQAGIRHVATYPFRGYRLVEFSKLYRNEVRSWVTADCIVHYATSSKPRLILGLLHGKRDVVSIMRERLA